MPPAPPSFVQLCRSAKIAPTAPAQRLQFLKDAGIPAPEGLGAKPLAERCAALAWARDSLQNDVDPETWSTLLTPALLQYLQGLYVLPPHKGTAPPPSNVRRLADIIITYTPDDPAAAAPQAPQPQAQPNQAGGINTTRPDGQGAGASSAPPPPPTPPNPHGGAITSPGKRKWMMHDELLDALDPAVYQSLDLASGMPYKSRVKLQESCRKGDMANLLDRTTSAAFSHHTLLTLSDGAHFDPPIRGLALAGAGRSATVPGAPGQTLSDTVTRDAHLRTLRECWQEALPAFAADGELSGSHVDNLWRGAHFIFTVRAARSATWGVPEVETACNEQLSSLSAYRSAVASVINRVARAYAGVDIPRAVNRAYLQFFLPFWWEHILERGRLDASAAEKQVTLILSPRAAPAPAVAAAPVAPAQPAAPPPLTPAPWPFPPPPVYHYLPPAPLPPYPPPTGATPYPRPAPPHAGPTPPHPPQRGGPTTLFAGKPLAPVIVGNNFGIEPPAGSKPCTCAISRKFPGRMHRAFECPFRYFTVCGSCPGWTPTGDRDPASWLGDDITAACQEKWRTFAAPLLTARVANGSVVNF